jgi:DNA polymerase III delta prime subunit
MDKVYFVGGTSSSTMGRKHCLLMDQVFFCSQTLLMDEVYFVGGTSSSTMGRKHCLLMDEVDGMAGNEDRGGLQELVALIKSSQIPVICMCNDRNHQKMRTLSNYCFDLRFQRPRVEQIKVLCVLSRVEQIKVQS